MDVLPLAVSAMPDTSFLRLAGPRPTLVVDKLSQADVSDAGCVLADQVDVGVQDGGVDGLAVLSQKVLKVESVEVHPLYQVAQRFRLKRGQSRVADLSVCLKVSIVDCFYQLFSDLDNFLFACLRGGQGRAGGGVRGR